MLYILVNKTQIKVDNIQDNKLNSERTIIFYYGIWMKTLTNIGNGKKKLPSSVYMKHCYVINCNCISYDFC